MARMATRPRQVRVWYRGLPCMLDLVRCRRALLERQIDGGPDSMESLAKAVDVSRSTASRFFSGRPTSLAVTLKILEVLHLKFDQVAVLEERWNEPDEPSGACAGRAPAPRAPHPEGAYAR